MLSMENRICLCLTLRPSDFHCINPDALSVPQSSDQTHDPQELGQNLEPESILSLRSYQYQSPLISFNLSVTSASTHHSVCELFLAMDPLYLVQNKVQSIMVPSFSAPQPRISNLFQHGLLDFPFIFHSRRWLDTFTHY